MSYVADLHFHSRFSRACSKDLTIPNLALWAKLKGIDLLISGDFLHPVWLAELKGSLTDLNNGFYDYEGIKFVLGGEISTIYSHQGKVRRIHQVVMVSSLEKAQKLAQALLFRGAKLSSDGRPILGLSSRNLLELCLSVDSSAIFIPAHIWTPWFGIFGSASGYDSLKDCFEDLTGQIVAVETGLSSDPAMNWRIGELDNLSIVSFSDAHSLAKLGRELTVMEGDLSSGYQGLWETLKKQKIKETVEFYPEEGKYHYSGHRDCQVVFSPQNEKEQGIKCPRCGKKLTVGVMSRVEQLASRSNDELRTKRVEGVIKSEIFPQRPGYRMLVPLLEIISEALSVTWSNKVVGEVYRLLVGRLGGEFRVLTQVSVEEIGQIAGSRIAEGIDKVRRGDLKIEPGYDGVYGVVGIWGDVNKRESQIELFD